MLKTQMYPITMASLEKWAQEQIIDDDADDSCSSPAHDILEALDKTIEQLSDVYLEVYQDSDVEVPADVVPCRIKVLALYGFDDYQVKEIDAYKDSRGRVYADIEDLM